MTAKNFIIKQGDNFSCTFEFEGVSRIESAIFAAKERYTDANYMIKKTNQDGIVVNGNKVMLSLSQLDTNIEPNTYLYELQVVISGAKRTPVFGTLSITPQLIKE